MPAPDSALTKFAKPGTLFLYNFLHFLLASLGAVKTSFTGAGHQLVEHLPNAVNYNLSKRLCVAACGGGTHNWHACLHCRVATIADAVASIANTSCASNAQCHACGVVSPRHVLLVLPSRSE